MLHCAFIQLPNQFVKRTESFTIGCRFHFGKQAIGCKYRKLKLVPKIEANPEWLIEASHGYEIDYNSFLHRTFLISYMFN